LQCTTNKDVIIPWALSYFLPEQPAYTKAKCESFWTCELGNESSSFIKGMEYLDYLRYNRFLKDSEAGVDCIHLTLEIVQCTALGTMITML
jgi:hypothetical protein